MIKYIFHILWIIIIITFILSSLFSIYNFGTFIDINLNTFALNNANDNKQLNNTINDFFKYTTDNINILLPTIPAINPIINIPDNLQKYWIDNQDRLGLKGKFLPNDSKLIPYQKEKE